MAALVPERPTWLEIDRSALLNNVRQLRALLTPPSLLTGVVKANAYGHGAVMVCRLLVEAGVDRLAVATVGEALELRAADIHLPILVLGYTPGALALEAVAQEITLTVFDLETAGAIAAAAQASGKRARVHLKVNTGMNRLGVAPGDARALLSALSEMRSLEVEGIFTHFATSDTDRAYAEEQFRCFVSVLDELAAAGLRPAIAHAANSAATLTMPHAHLEMVRCGIALYGLDPDEDDTPLPSTFVPVMSWKAQVAQVRHLQPGDAVSYGREFVAQQPMTVATIPVGYADGFPRRPRTWGSVLIHGQPAPLVGRVCMDQCVVDVTSIAAQQPVRQGDEVVLIGRQGRAELSAAEVARRIGTNNYDVVSRILARVPRYVVEGCVGDEGKVGDEGRHE
ncbi:MAG: alanine racemase [Caldilineaceae bacterium]|nr:alanine racemase [Caldilineaceae bacterium]